MARPKKDELVEGALYGKVLQGKAAARLLNLSPQALAQHVGNGHIKKGKNGDYELLLTMHSYIDFLKGEKRDNTASAKNGILQDLRAQELSLKVIEREGSLLEAARSEALAMITDIIGGLKADLFSISAKSSLDLSVRKKVDELIENALTEAGGKARIRAQGVDTDLDDIENLEEELAA